MRTTLVLAPTLLVLACGGEPTPRPADAASGSCTVAAEDTVHTTKTPGDLVGEYLHWNTSGTAFLGARDHLEGVFECDRSSAGTPRYVVVEGVIIDSTTGADSARFVVRWETLGRLDGSGGDPGELRYSERAAIVRDTLHLKRRSWGWRIVDCCAGVFLQPTQALLQWGLTPEDLEGIEERYFAKGENDSATAAAYRAMLLNARLDDRVTLTDGEWSSPDAGSITLGSVLAADLDGDGDRDAVASVDFTSTGTLAGSSLHAFRYQDGRLVPAGQVGLNHQPRHWMIRRGTVHVVDLEWGPSDPHCCPTAPRWKALVLRGDSLVRP